MASLITNMPSLTAQRNLGMTQGAFHKAVTRLSSGLRINSAADDAAGLFLSEKFKSQVRGLGQASRNAQDGISLIQTAEGALQSVHDMLGRMRELAIQSANGVLTQADRDIIGDEVSELLKEIDRTRNSASFNGLRLLTGERSPETDVANVLIASGVDALTSDGTAVVATGYQLDVAVKTGAAGYETTQITITGSDTVTTQTVTIGVPPLGETRKVAFSQFGLTLEVNDAIGTAAVAADMFDVVAPTAPTDGSLSAYGPTLQVGTDNSTTSRLTLGGLTDIGTYALGLTENPATLSTGEDVAADWDAYDADPTNLLAPNTGDPNMGVAGSANGVKSQAGAGVALGTIDNAILTVSKLRANLGAYQNRMEYTMTSIGVGMENMTAANSRIRDADVAAEVSAMVQSQILSQSAMAVLAQSNSAPQALLSLLR